jgi:DNA primase
MACHLAGVPTAVATSGTSFGEGHIRILRRLLMDASEFRGEVIFTFDGDAAGQRAALKAFGLEDKFVTQTFVAVQPDGLDPCDLRLAHGDAAVRDLVAQRVPLVEFAIRSAVRRYDLDTNEGRLSALDAAAPIVAQIKDRGLRQRYAISLDRWLGLMDEDFVLARVRDHAGRAQASVTRPAAATAAGSAGPPPGRPEHQPPGDGADVPYDRDNPVVQVEREALKLAVQRPGLCGPGFAAIGPEGFSVPAHADLFALICKLAGWADPADPDAGTVPAGGGPSGMGAGGREWARSLREAAPDDAAQALVTELAVEPPHSPGADGEPDARYAAAVLARVEELAVSRQIAQVKSRMQRMDPVTAQAEHARLFGDLIALEKRRRVLVDKLTGA